MVGGRIILLGFAAFAAFLGGCATPNTVHYATINAPPHPFVRHDPATVDVFVSKLPARPYVEVGMFQVYQGMTNDGSLQSTDDMIRTLKAHAGLRGCDGVQVMGIDHEPGYKHSTRKVVQGVCVVYTDEQAQQAASPPAAAKPLEGEGKACMVQEAQEAWMPPCPEPLACVHNRCASPYQ